MLGLLGSTFHFYSNFDRTFCKQTLETLIRRRVLRCLVWACTICLRPTKRTLGLYGTNMLVYMLYAQCIDLGMAVDPGMPGGILATMIS